MSFLCPIREYLTGFHKRKVERRKAALAEIRKKIKEEQIRVREEVSVKFTALETVLGYLTYARAHPHVFGYLLTEAQRIHKDAEGEDRCSR